MVALKGFNSLLSEILTHSVGLLCTGLAIKNRDLRGGDSPSVVSDSLTMRAVTGRPLSSPPASI
jgi:hypothetical protein